jgi:hypothetical protein
MVEREKKYQELREKMEDSGFQFEKEQRPHFQSKREKELKFIHPQLLKKFEDEGFKTKAKKFYIKPLSDDYNAEIGLATGKTSSLSILSIEANTIDTFDQSPAWSKDALDKLLQ